jgi:hypothetical protein
MSQASAAALSVTRLAAVATPGKRPFGEEGSEHDRWNLRDKDDP